MTKSIEERQRAEKAFHEKKFGDEYKARYYRSGFKSDLMARFWEELGDLEGKKVLEVGCGEGWLTLMLAKRGAQVWTFDISEEAVRKVKKLVERNGFGDRVEARPMAAEKLEYESGTFDLVVGNAILHHVDLNAIVAEMNRVLVEGGKAFFMEPLGHNLFINVFRWATPGLRSKDEKPFSFKDLEVFEQGFRTFRHEEYYLISFFALALYFVGLKKLVVKGRDLLSKVDRIVLRGSPGMRKYCWYSLLMMEK